MLENLEARWRNEQTPQSGVRLAEALHRMGDSLRAEGILNEVESRLDSESRDLAARVAVGGLRLALDQPAGAARVLEQVVQADPTHLKANKLLVEVYLDLDQRDRARDRLDLYRLLNPGDPEIEALEGLVVGVTVPAVEPAPVALVAAGGRRLRVAAGDPFAELTAAAPPPREIGELLELAPAAPRPPAATATLGTLYQEQGHREDAERVFRDVLAHEPENRRAQHGLAALAGNEEEVAVAPPAASMDAEEDADRARRIGVLREYLARIQRGRGAMAGE